MMKRINFMSVSAFLFAVALLTGATSCEEKTFDTNTNPTGTVALNFKATHGGQPLVMYKSFTHFDGSPITYKVLNFFISEVTLFKGTDSVVISKASFIDFTKNHSDIKTAPDGETVRFEKVPIGEYDRIRIGYGVAPKYNDQAPGDFAAGTPLAFNGNYWEAWNSYIFSRIEGDLDTGAQREPFLYHSGINESYQMRSYTKSIEVIKDAETTVGFEFPVEKSFYNDQDSIDIRALPSSHSGAIGTPEYEVVVKILNNTATAIKLQ